MSTTDAPDVAVLHLRASYDRRVFTDVTFTARAGAVTVVSGPSGIGKTTLVRVLLGRRAPDRGDITIGGRSVVVGRTVARTVTVIHRDRARPGPADARTTWRAHP